MLCVLFLLLRKHLLWPLSRQDPGTKKSLVHPDLVLSSQAACMLSLPKCAALAPAQSKGQVYCKALPATL